MSRYRGDLSISDREDLASFREPVCRWCKGTGFVPDRRAGNPMAGSPCGCDESQDEEQDDD